jgi:hypothetical protein
MYEGRAPTCSATTSDRHAARPRSAMSGPRRARLPAPAPVSRRRRLPRTLGNRRRRRDAAGRSGAADGGGDRRTVGSAAVNRPRVALVAVPANPVMRRLQETDGEQTPAKHHAGKDPSPPSARGQPHSPGGCRTLQFAHVGISSKIRQRGPSWSRLGPTSVPRWDVSRRSPAMTMKTCGVGAVVA